VGTQPGPKRSFTVALPDFPDHTIFDRFPRTPTSRNLIRVNVVNPEIKWRMRLRALVLAFVYGTLVLAMGLLFVPSGARARPLEGAGSQPCSQLLPEREASVIRAALAEMSPREPLIMIEQTGQRPSGSGGLPVVKGSLSTKLSYLYNNNEPRCVSPWNGAPPIRVFRASDVEARPADVPFSSWFKATFGAGAIYQVSRVGFSADGKEALVSIAVYCGRLCGHGTDLRLVWTGDRWQVVDRALSWIA
jgi:hypothetical protein